MGDFGPFYSPPFGGLGGKGNGEFGGKGNGGLGGGGARASGAKPVTEKLVYYFCFNKIRHFIVRRRAKFDNIKSHNIPSSPVLCERHPKLRKANHIINLMQE